MKPRLCLTELRTYAPDGGIASVILCRQPMRLSTANTKGPASVWVYVCTNPTCGTGHVLTDSECREVLAEGSV